MESKLKVARGTTYLLGFSYECLEKELFIGTYNQLIKYDLKLADELKELIYKQNMDINKEIFIYLC